MERCPACRARLLGQPVCPRCACDFSLALAAQANARRHLCAAVRALAAGDRPAATQSVRQSGQFQRSDLAWFLSALIASPAVTADTDEPALPADWQVGRVD